MGDRIAGGTVFWLSDTVDGGPVQCRIGASCAPRIPHRASGGGNCSPWACASSAASWMRRQGRLVMRDQDHSLATWEPSFDGAPRLYRPELPQIGTTPDGWTVIK